MPRPFYLLALFSPRIGEDQGEDTIRNSSPSINTRSDSITTSGDLVRYTASRNRNNAWPWIRVLDGIRAIFDSQLEFFFRYFNPRLNNPIEECRKRKKVKVAASLSLTDARSKDAAGFVGFVKSAFQFCCTECY